VELRSCWKRLVDQPRSTFSMKRSRYQQRHNVGPRDE
jgi:hypothetical protein